MVPLWANLETYITAETLQDPLAAVKVAYTIHTRLWTWWDQVGDIAAGVNDANPAYVLPPVPDFQGYEVKLAEGTISYQNVTILAAYLEPLAPPTPAGGQVQDPPLPTPDAGPTEAELLSWSRLPRDQLTSEQLNALLKSQHLHNKRPTDKLYVVPNINYGKAKAAAGDPPDGVNGPTCFNYHFGGNCRWGHLCNRAADHKTTDKADVAARAQYHAKLKAAGLA